MKYIYDIYQIMSEKKLMLIYEGKFTQDITKSFLSMAEKNLDTIGEESSTKRKVFNVMVECLQNICKHSDNIEDKPEKSAIFMIGREENHYVITSGNYVLKNNVAAIASKLDQVNNLDKEGLKSLYKEILSNGELSDRGGAGLGFIDIARKSGQKLEYDFQPVNDKYSFFSFKTHISRGKE